MKTWRKKILAGTMAGFIFIFNVIDRGFPGIVIVSRKETPKEDQ